MTFKAMIAALALLPGLSGSIPATLAETLGNDPLCSAASPFVVEPLVASTPELTKPARHGAPQQLLTTQFAEASGTVGFSARRGDFVCPTATCTHSSEAPAAGPGHAAVPQPKMLMLCGLGLLLFGLYRRRK